MLKRLRLWRLPLVLVAVVFVVAFSLVGCQGSNSNNNKTDGGNFNEGEKNENNPITVDFPTDSGGLEQISFNNRHVLGPFRDGLPRYKLSPREEMLAVWGYGENGGQSIWVLNPEIELINLLLRHEDLPDSNLLELEVAGWLDEEHIIYAVTGEHGQGQYAGQMGMVLYRAHIDGTVEELAWTESEYSRLKNFYLTEDRGAAVAHLGNSILNYNFSSEQLTEVKSSLPSYDGLFQVHPAPSGWLVAYSKLDSDKQQVYVLDIATGEEVQIAPDNRYNFFPRWSPDGKKLAFLSSELTSGGYDIIPGEAGPIPLASSVGVAEISSPNIASYIEAEAMAGEPVWAKDSTQLAFLTGTSESTDIYFEPQIDWKHIYYHDLTTNEGSEIIKFEKDGYFKINSFASNDKLYYFQDLGQGLELWKAQPKESKRDKLTKISGWQEDIGIIDNKVFFMTGTDKGDELAIFKGGEQEVLTESGGWKTSLRVTDDKVIFIRGENEPPFPYFLEIIFL